MQSDQRGDESRDSREHIAAELPGVQELLQENPVKECVRLYYYRVAVDVAVLVVGVIYSGMVDAETDMIPTYMIVRGSLWLACLPFNVVLDFIVPSTGWRNKKYIAMVVMNKLLELTIFGWLIYGTVIISSRWPGSDSDVCNKPCYLTAFSSILLDWLWRLVITFAFFFPLCWFISDQWTMALFVLFVRSKKSRKHPSNASVRPV